MSETMFRKQSAAGPFAFFHDLIARKQAKEQLQFQATILHNMSEGVIVTDLHSHIVYWNEGATSLFGYTAEEMLDKTPALLYPEAARAQLLPDVEHILAGEDYIGEWRGQRKDGALIWIEIKTTVLRTTRGAAIGFIGVAKDITERKQAAEARLQLAAIVESSDDAIIGKTLDGIITNWNMAAERMYGYTAEEAVGQPITLLFPSDRQDEFVTIMQQIARGERVDHYVMERVRKDGTIIAVSVTISPIKDSEGRMESQITRLTKLIEDLLDVSKIQAGGLEYAEERIAIDALIQDIVETIQYTNTTHTIRIHGTSHKYVIGDSDRLGQVFINLMTNAIKYSPQATSVDVSIAAANDEVLVGVRAYGVGIPEEHLSKVFERFYRVHDAQEKTFPGLGMGLYISHEIVKRHGGKIWVESTEGKGATFYIALPTETEDEVSAV